MKSTSNLLMMRHSQSTYNFENRFTGWLDVPLTDDGIREAENAAEKLRGYRFDVA